MRLDEVLVLTRPLVGVDLESTGKDYRTAGICQIGLEIFVPGQPTREYKTLVNPIMSIPAEATEIHGITNEMVQGAPTFRQLAANLKLGLVDCDFVGYNLMVYDLPLMREEFRRAAIDWNYEDAAVIDAYTLWQRLEKRKLEDAVQRWLTPTGWGDEQPNESHAHDALWDVRMSSRVAAAQLRTTTLRTPRDVHTFCWPNRIDADGKLARLESGELTLTFGKWKDRPLRRVPADYRRWLLRDNTLGPRFRAELEASFA